MDNNTSGKFSDEEWKKWVEDVNINQGRCIEELEDKVSDLEVRLDNLYQWCRDAGVKMPMHSAVEELGRRK